MAGVRRNKPPRGNVIGWFDCLKDNGSPDDRHYMLKIGHVKKGDRRVHTIAEYRMSEQDMRWLKADLDEALLKLDALRVREEDEMRKFDYKSAEGI